MSPPPSPPIDSSHTPYPLSELESLSDSDWLDVSSRSDTASDSDDHEFQLPSRRSSISIGSSLGDDSEQAVGWEGLVDDGVDDDGMGQIPRSHSIGNDLVAVTAEPIGELARAMSYPEIPSLEPEVALDEERVREGLDQSMMSTLTSSRSSSAGHASTRTSIRDLRLSFPDPLTRSHEDYKQASRHTSLNSSFEDVSPPIEPLSTTEIIEADITATADVEDPGSPLIPVVQNKEAPLCDCNISQRYDLDIYLYGLESNVKASFVDELIVKAVEGGWGNDLQYLPPNKDARTRTLHVLREQGKHQCVAIHDVSRESLDRAPIVARTDTPSLAIVFLPYYSHFPISGHTLYLPVVASYDGSETSQTRRHSTASWNLLAIPFNKTLHLNPYDRTLSIAKERDLEQLKPLLAMHAINQVFDAHVLNKRTKVHHSHNVMPAATLTSLIFLMLGVASYMAFRPAMLNNAPPTRITTLSMPPSLPAVNHSSAIATRMGTNVAIVPSALKDLALAVFHPLSSTSAPVASSSRVGLPPSKLSPYSCKSLMISEQVQSTKDVILRPTSHLSTVLGVTTTAFISPSVEPSASGQPKMITSLSLKLPSSISEVIANTLEETRHDLQELTGALDDLMESVHHHASMMTKQSKARAQILRERVVSRNERAKDRAKQLKMMGGSLAVQAGETLKGRATVARNRAISLKDRIAPGALDVWNAYSTALATSRDADKENRPGGIPAGKVARGRRAFSF